MSKFIPFIVPMALLMAANYAKAQPAKGYEITFNSNIKDSQVYIGSYYGKRKVLVDSAKADAKGKAVFKSDTTHLSPGIYFMVSSAKVILFEFLVDEPQHFSMAADTGNLGNVAFTNSPDNVLFADYTKFLTGVSPQLQQLQQQYKSAKTMADSAAAQKQLSAKSAELTTYRNEIIKDHPQSMLAKLLEYAKVPDKPNVMKDGKADSVYQFYYVKDHYWDNADFSSDMLLRTPFFEGKLDDYMKYYVSPAPDSVINEINYMLLASRETKDLHHYLLGKFTDKYINPEFMGQDKVFLFLFENFYSKGDTTWLTSSQRKYIFDRAYSLMANQLNVQAAPLDMLDTANKPLSLYEVKAPLTFVAFWDPHCSHCKLQLPRVDSFYEAKWRNEGVKVFAVCVNDNVLDDWKKFIADNKMGSWYNAYEPDSTRRKQEQNGLPNYRQLYDITQTPTFFLLDKDKRIIAKGLSLEQYDGLIETKLNTKTATQ